MIFHKTQTFKKLNFPCQFCSYYETWPFVYFDGGGHKCKENHANEDMSIIY